MIALSSVDRVARAVDRAREVTVGAYLLHPGRLLDALRSAARRGVRLHVRVEARPYHDAGAATFNAHAVAGLVALGADAKVVDGLHLKGAVVDGRLYLDDRNWADRGGDTVVRDDDPRDVRLARDAIDGLPVRSSARLAIDKTDALDVEDRVLRGARAGEVIDVQSETLSFGPQVYATLAHLTHAGRRVRLLVNRRALARNPRERTALTDLAADGVAVRVTNSTEKFAIVGREAWVGSANATYGVPTQRDWGLRSDSRPLRAHLRAAFAQRWTASKPLA